ncbi:uncharacterized protein J4E87_005188 [Alternaria ethzedia]|uniref:uncharacterized protein n=1 Tax=Alternaria ethzedia TaxID=181014 RepID=UPI0020C4B3D3|nr:uncharacterized protein J4E87_005188 [Alternaria ethzedia]KAI4625341.1 hypothetical protein J4E87_005188 [Alternaria ethzedia]
MQYLNAQCSGKRDPTKFIKKSDLVTPRGIDHDYNFLSSIERNLEKAERVAGTTAESTPQDGLSNRERMGVQYGKLENAAGVKIMRAPKGMSRQKENKSHMSATKKATRNIVWTVEWFDETKRRVLTETSSTQSIQDAQPFVQQGSGAKSKKRKLNNEAPASQSSQSDPPHLPQNDVAPTAPDQDQPIEQHEVNSELQVNNAGPEGVTPGRGTPATEEKQQPTKRQADLAETRPGDTRTDGQSMGSGQHRVFLLKPRTSTNRHVLIPLDPSQSLGESLHGRTILEFPTIHVFPAGMEKLPEDYMLEEEYAKLEGEQQREFDEMMQELDPEILKRLKEGEGRMPGDSSGGGGDEEVDSKRILDVLKQDLGGRL